METIRNAANTAASYVGLGGTEATGEHETSRIAGGEAPQTAATGSSQSGVEPVSGKLGRGEGGEPYDAGNLDEAATDPSSDYKTPHGTDNSQSGLTSSSGNRGLTGSGFGSTTNSKTSSEPLGEKIRETFGVGGGNRHAAGLSSREEGPGYGTSSKRDRDSTLGSVIGHGSNPDKYLYSSKNAPGLGGHRIGDEFTNFNTRNVGADSLPASVGSDAAAGKAKHSGTHSSSGLTSGRSENDRYGSGSNTTSGTGESLTQKAKEYLPGTSSDTGTTGLSGTSSHPTTNQNTSLSGSGRSGYGESNSTYASGNSSALPVRTHDSTLTAGDRSLASNSRDGASIGGNSSGLTGTGSPGLTGGLTGSSTTTTGSSLTGSHGHSHGLSNVACEAEQEGYKPHGGHPIGEAAHGTGQQTWLDYRNDPTLPVARANPADL